MKSIVLLGASGFLGHHFLLNRKKKIKVKAISRNDKGLTNHYDNVDWYKTDISSENCLEQFLEKDDVVVNLIYASDKDKNYNLHLLENIINSCQKRDIYRLIHCSSAVVTGRTKINVIDEETQCFPITNYQKTKYMLEELVINACKNGIDTAVLRPTAILGIGGENLKKLVWSLVNEGQYKLWIKSLLFGARPMHLVPVRNVVNSLEALIYNEKKMNGQIYNISSDYHKNNTYRNIEKIILKNMSISYQPPSIAAPLFIVSILLSVLGKRDEDINKIYLSDKIRSLDYKETESLEQAIQEFAIHFLSKHHNK
jgi:nucleoside-diphosphate-sugar epimerase